LARGWTCAARAYSRAHVYRPDVIPGRRVPTEQIKTHSLLRHHPYDRVTRTRRPATAAGTGASTPEQVQGTGFMHVRQRHTPPLPSLSRADDVMADCCRYPFTASACCCHLFPPLPAAPLLNYCPCYHHLHAPCARVLPRCPRRRYAPAVAATAHFSSYRVRLPTPSPGANCYRSCPHLSLPTSASLCVSFVDLRPPH